MQSNKQALLQWQRECRGILSDKLLADHDADLLVKRADEALYRSKQNGRNQVTHCADLREIVASNDGV